MMKNSVKFSNVKLDRNSALREVLRKDRRTGERAEFDE